VTGSHARLTNAPWAFDAGALETALGLHVRLANDFEAQAWAVGRLAEADLLKLGGGAPAPGAAWAVIGPGTGLGVAGLLPGPKGSRAVIGEGGHMTLAPRDDEQLEILSRLRGRFSHVSAERLLSGPGLVLLSGELAEPVQARFETAEALVNAAQSPENSDQQLLARRCLAIFFDLLGAVAGNVALLLGARGGVYLTGGILPGLRRELEASSFREAFEDKGRMREYLGQIPCYLVLAQDPAFVGLAAMAQAWNCGLLGD
jgi:glucokinase